MDKFQLFQRNAEEATELFEAVNRWLEREGASVVSWEFLIDDGTAYIILYYTPAIKINEGTLRKKNSTGHNEQPDASGN